MPRVIADVGLLQAHADRIASLDDGRRQQVDALRTALDDFFASGSAFGPTSSDLPEHLHALRRDAAIDGAGVAATAAAFAEAEVLIADPFVGDWRPDDAWIERARRRFLVEHHPWALQAAAPVMDPAEAMARLRQIDRLLEAARAGGWPSPAGVEALLEERAAILADGVVLVDALSDAVGAWVGPDNDPILDTLLADRRYLVDVLADGDVDVAARMLELLAAGVGAGAAFELAVGEATLEDRIAEVMAVEGASRAEAIQIIEAMDLAIASMMAEGATAEEAVAAFALADQLDLDLDLARGRAAASGLSVIEVLGRMATAQALDMTDDELRAFELLREHFEALDGARGGGTDDRVSEADLRFVVDNPDLFLPAQVLAAQAVLDEPLLRNRLDTASSNIDILDSDEFGSREPGDGVISVADIDAFLVRTQLNALLADHRLEIDTAAQGGAADGYVSENDLEAWLDANPGAPVEVRDAVSFMLEAQLHDRSWLERNREALAMGAAVLGGGVVIVLTAGTATPVVVVMAGGFAAGATAAGLTTVGVNHLTGESLTDGVFRNAMEGGMIGMTVAGLPGAWSSARTITQGVTVQGVGASATLATDTASIVSGGGVDLLLPDDWEDEIHGVAGVVEDALEPLTWLEQVPDGVMRDAFGSGTVWDDVVATDTFYPDTVVPRSFRLRVNDAEVWVHPNATEHLAERGYRSAGDAALGTQVQIDSLQAALQELDRTGVSLGRFEHVGGWELEINMRPGDELPVVNHALYRG